MLELDVGSQVLSILVIVGTDFFAFQRLDEAMKVWQRLGVVNRGRLSGLQELPRKLQGAFSLALDLRRRTNTG